MPTDYAFRLSTYLTLALACAGLGYAEHEYLPEVTAFTAVVVVSLVFAFRAEGRFSLSLTASNLVGGSLFVVAVAWIGWNWKQEQSLINTLPWPAGLLPFVGPVVVALVVAKLFRPKHVGDWWGMQGLGLAAVGMAASMTEDPGFVILLGLYAVAGVWSLTLFYHRRAAGLIPPVPPADPAAGVFDLSAWFPWFFARERYAPVVAGPPPQTARSRTEYRFGRHNVRRALAWLAVAGLAALPLFFFTPRSDGIRWQLGRNRTEVGYSPDVAIELNRIGDLRTSQETAFEVFVHDLNGKPLDILPPDQRWRGYGYIEYGNGKWQRASMPRVFSDPVLLDTAPKVPTFGPDTVILDYTYREQIRGILLADPVYYEPGKPSPAVCNSGRRTQNAYQSPDGSFIAPSPASGPSRTCTQAYLVPADRSLGVPFQKTKFGPGADSFQPLKGKPPSKLFEVHSRRLLERFVRDGKLPQLVLDRRDPVTFDVNPDDYRAVGEAYRDYLADGREFKYTLSITRMNKAIDPIEDFLLNTKAGQCERFASALALMLRAVGVPAQFVLGFKGCESSGEGRYVVREEQAHAWVEAVVKAGDDRWQWMTLDPTPTAAEDAATDSVAGLWDAARETSRRFFSDYIVGLTPEVQRRLAADAGEAVASHAAAAALGLTVVGLGGLAALVRKRLRRRPSTSHPVSADTTPWFTRMIALISTKGLTFAPGMTPVEFARSATESLSHDPALRHVAGIPERVVAAVYENRYAGRPLSPARLAEVERDVDRLAEALQGIRREE